MGFAAYTEAQASTAVLLSVPEKAPVKPAWFCICELGQTVFERPLMMTTTTGGLYWLTCMGGIATARLYPSSYIAERILF